MSHGGEGVHRRKMVPREPDGQDDSTFDAHEDRLFHAESAEHLEGVGCFPGKWGIAGIESSSYEPVPAQASDFLDAHGILEQEVVSLTSDELWEHIGKVSAREGTAILRELLEKGSDLFEADSLGRTAAHRAAGHNRGWELHFLLAVERTCRQRNPEMLRGQESMLCVKDAQGRTLLHIVSSRGFRLIARYLVSAWKEVAVDARDDLGRTALHEAAANKHHEIIQILLKAGADPRSKNNDSQTPLMLVRRHGFGRSQYLLEQAEKRTHATMDPLPGPLALFNCQASYAFDKVLTPAAYVMDDAYEPPEIRKGTVLPLSMLVFCLFGIALLLPLLFALPVLGGLAYFLKFRMERHMKEGSTNLREIAVALWRGCMLAYAGLTIVFWIVPLYAEHCKHRLQFLALMIFSGGIFVTSLACFATCGADPGLVDFDSESLSYALQHVMEHGGPPSDFDPVAIQRRPLRSKLCRESGGVCIARFDHFCIWINRPVGAGNHLLFLCFLALQTFSLLDMFLLQCSFLWAGGVVQNPVKVFSYPYSGIFIYAVHAGTVEAALFFLLVYQCRNVLANLTTNEHVNLTRYPHFWKSDAEGRRVFNNPFDKGWYSNACEFLGLSGHVEYVRLFRSRAESGPYRSNAEGIVVEDATELEVLVVPSGWSSGEESKFRYLPPALPLSIAGEERDEPPSHSLGQQL